MTPSHLTLVCFEASSHVIMRISFLSNLFFIMGTALAIHYIIVYSNQNIVHEAEAQTGNKKEAEKEEEAVEEKKIKTQTIHLPLLRRLKTPDVSIIY